MIGDRAEAKDIQAGAVLRFGLRGFRGKVHQAGVLDVLLDVHGATDRAARWIDGIGVLRAFARARLPVHDARSRRRARDILNQDALRAQGTVVQALLVGVFQRLGQVANDLKPLVDAEQLAHLAQQKVKPDRLGVVIEDERRA